MHMAFQSLKRFICIFWLCLLPALTFIVAPAQAEPLIRDAEIEHTLRSYADPIFKADGLKPSSIKIFIINSKTLNAYVAGGANMFLYTGILLECSTPDMVLGIMAHETGHIAGGHLARGTEKLKSAELGTIFTYALGAAAAAASGRADAAAAVMAGGQTTIAHNFMAYTRGHEESADQAALNALDKLGISASGMIKVFDVLRRHEREHAKSPDPYMVTHPLTSLRIDHIRNHIDNSPIPEGTYPKAFDMPHKRMIAKLYGFLQPPEKTFLRYPQSDKSIPARMARAIAYYKMPDLTRSIAEMDGLIAESPQDPFFHELKGQILFENNKPKEALASYRRAVELLPDAPLILVDLARVEMAQNDPSLVPSAIAHLEKASRLDDSNATNWHELAIAYGKQNNQGMASLSLAEEAMLLDDPKRALSQIEVALKQLPAGSPAARRAQDLKSHALDVKKQQKDDKSPF